MSDSVAAPYDPYTDEQLAQKDKTLRLLTHAANCKKPPTVKCGNQHCKAGKAMLQHIMQCKDITSCEKAFCAPAKLTLRHGKKIKEAADKRGIGGPSGVSSNNNKQQQRAAAGTYKPKPANPLSRKRQRPGQLHAQKLAYQGLPSLPFPSVCSSVRNSQLVRPMSQKKRAKLKRKAMLTISESKYEDRERDSDSSGSDSSSSSDEDDGSEISSASEYSSSDDDGSSSDSSSSSDDEDEDEGKCFREASFFKTIQKQRKKRGSVTQTLPDAFLLGSAQKLSGGQDKNPAAPVRNRSMRGAPDGRLAMMDSMLLDDTSDSSSANNAMDDGSDRNLAAPIRKLSLTEEHLQQDSLKDASGSSSDGASDKHPVVPARHGSITETNDDDHTRRGSGGLEKMEEGDEESSESSSDGNESDDSGSSIDESESEYNENASVSLAADLASDSDDSSSNGSGSKSDSDSDSEDGNTTEEPSTAIVSADDKAGSVHTTTSDDGRSDDGSNSNNDSGSSHDGGSRSGNDYLESGPTNTSDDGESDDGSKSSIDSGSCHSLSSESADGSSARSVKEDEGKTTTRASTEKVKPQNGVKNELKTMPPLVSTAKIIKAAGISTPELSAAPKIASRKTPNSKRNSGKSTSVVAKMKLPKPAAADTVGFYSLNLQSAGSGLPTIRKSQVPENNVWVPPDISALLSTSTADPGTVDMSKTLDSAESTGAAWQSLDTESEQTKKNKPKLDYSRSPAATWTPPKVSELPSFSAEAFDMNLDEPSKSVDWLPVEGKSIGLADKERAAKKDRKLEAVVIPTLWVPPKVTDIARSLSLDSSSSSSSDSGSDSDCDLSTGKKWVPPYPAKAMSSKKTASSIEPVIPWTPPKLDFSNPTTATTVGNDKVTAKGRNEDVGWQKITAKAAVNVEQNFATGVEMAKKSLSVTKPQVSTFSSLMQSDSDSSDDEDLKRNMGRKTGMGSEKIEYLKPKDESSPSAANSLTAEATSSALPNLKPPSGLAHTGSHRAKNASSTTDKQAESTNCVEKTEKVDAKGPKQGKKYSRFSWNDSSSDDDDSSSENSNDDDVKGGKLWSDSTTTAAVAVKKEKEAAIVAQREKKQAETLAQKAERERVAKMDALLVSWKTKQMSGGMVSTSKSSKTPIEEAGSKQTVAEKLQDSTKSSKWGSSYSTTPHKKTQDKGPLPPSAVNGGYHSSNHVWRGSNRATQQSTDKAAPPQKPASSSWQDRSKQNGTIGGISRNAVAGGSTQGGAWADKQADPSVSADSNSKKIVTEVKKIQPPEVVQPMPGSLSASGKSKRFEASSSDGAPPRPAMPSATMLSGGLVSLSTKKKEVPKPPAGSLNGAPQRPAMPSATMLSGGLASLSTKKKELPKRPTGSSNGSPQRPLMLSAAMVSGGLASLSAKKREHSKQPLAQGVGLGSQQPKPKMSAIAQLNAELASALATRSKRPKKLVDPTVKATSLNQPSSNPAFSSMSKSAQLNNELASALNRRKDQPRKQCLPLPQNRKDASNKVKTVVKGQGGLNSELAYALARRNDASKQSSASGNNGPGSTGSSFTNSRKPKEAAVPSWMQHSQVGSAWDKSGSNSNSQKNNYVRPSTMAPISTTPQRQKKREQELAYAMYKGKGDTIRSLSPISHATGGGGETTGPSSSAVPKWRQMRRQNANEGGGVPALASVSASSSIPKWKTTEATTSLSWASKRKEATTADQQQKPTVHSPPRIQSSWKKPGVESNVTHSGTDDWLTSADTAISADIGTSDPKTSPGGTASTTTIITPDSTTASTEDALPLLSTPPSSAEMVVEDEAPQKDWWSMDDDDDDGDNWWSGGNAAALEAIVMEALGL